MWRSDHSYPHSSCLKSWMSWRKRILMAMSAFLYSTSQQYVSAVEGLYCTIPKVPECLSLRPNWFPPLFPPSWTKGEATLACGRGGGKANSDELKESLALCLLCGVCCAISCLAPVGQKGRHFLSCVKSLFAEHWPGNGAARGLCLHYTCWALARKRGS
jgi:hypothetical protein